MSDAAKVDPICGNCFKPKSEHFFEREIYCFSDTNGDLFTDEPREDWVLEQMSDRHPEIYEQIRQEWKVKNGHGEDDRE